MGVMQAIVKGFKESKNLSKLILIFLGFNFVMGLLMLPFVPQDAAVAPSAVPLLISLLSVFLFIFVQAGALGVIKKQIKTNSWAMSDFVESGKKFYVRILGLFAVIIVIAVIAILIISLLSALIFAIANNGLTRALVAAIVTILSIMAAVVLLFPIYAVVADDIGPVVAVKKCCKCAMSNFWPILGLLVVLFAVTFVIAFVIGLLTALLAGILPVMLGQIITLLINSGLQGYLSVVMMVALMSYYLAKSGPCSCGCEVKQEESPVIEADAPVVDEEGPSAE
jgi:hypothetical protein